MKRFAVAIMDNDEDIFEVRLVNADDKFKALIKAVGDEETYKDEKPPYETVEDAIEWYGYVNIHLTKPIEID